MSATTSERAQQRDRGWETEMEREENAIMHTCGKMLTISGSRWRACQNNSITKIGKW